MAEGLVFQVKAFEGPLDLLLTLIQTHKMDIYDIPIAEILEQYLLQIERMQQAKMEVAAINPYLRHGDTELTAQHVLLCSRDCLPPTLMYRASNSVWYDTSQVNPWRGSALWETLNNADNGIIKLVEATALGAYIFGGPNGKGPRAMLPTMGYAW